MKKILTLLLLICFVLSLYTYVFLGIQSFSFEEAYTSTLTFLTNIGSIFEPLKNITDYARYAVDFIKTLFDFGVTTLEKIINVVSDLPGTIKGFITDAVTNIGDFFTTLADKISEFFTTLYSKVSGYFTDLGNRISGFFGNIGNSISSSYQDMITGIGQVRDKVSGGFTEIWENIKTWFKKTLE